jgi:glucosamine 6-phosphate synthetase-like amidotransferase/phosphosugar isomerase protein
MDNTLFVTISQSGETADTLAALQQIKQLKHSKEPIPSSAESTSLSSTSHSDLAPTPSSSGSTRGSQDASTDLNVPNPSHSDLAPTPSSTESTSLPSSSGSTRGSQDASTGLNIPTLTICNVAESSLTRESDLTFLTHAGPEIGVASTKAFTTQLVALALLLTSVGKAKGLLSEERETIIVKGLQKLPGLVKSALGHEDQIMEIAKTFADKIMRCF